MYLSIAIPICLGQLAINRLNYIFLRIFEDYARYSDGRLLHSFLVGEFPRRCAGERKKYTSERLDNVLQIG